VSRVLGVLAFLGCLAVVPLVVFLVAAADGDPQPDLDLPEEGEELWDWVTANPERASCPDSPAEEGL